jgi:hypothetical protein
VAGVRQWGRWRLLLLLLLLLPHVLRRRVGTKLLRLLQLSHVLVVLMLLHGGARELCWRARHKQQRQPAGAWSHQSLLVEHTQAVLHVRRNAKQCSKHSSLQAAHSLHSGTHRLLQARQHVRARPVLLLLLLRVAVAAAINVHAHAQQRLCCLTIQATQVTTRC